MARIIRRFGKHCLWNSQGYVVIGRVWKPYIWQAEGGDLDLMVDWWSGRVGCKVCWNIQHSTRLNPESRSYKIHYKYLQSLNIQFQDCMDYKTKSNWSGSVNKESVCIAIDPERWYEGSSNPGQLPRCTRFKQISHDQEIILFRFNSEIHNFLLSELNEWLKNIKNHVQLS